LRCSSLAIMTWRQPPRAKPSFEFHQHLAFFDALAG